MNEKELILIYYSNEKYPINGPGAVVKNMKKSLKKMKIKFIDYPICSEKKADIIKLIIFLIKSKNKIINVHQSGNKIPIIVYLISKINKKNEYYFTTHGCRTLEKDKISFSNKILEKILLNNFENIICVSEMYMNDIKRKFKTKGNLYFVNNAYIKINENFINKERLDGKNITFLLSGGIKRNKGVFESANLIKYIKNKFPEKNIILYILGSVVEEDFKELSDFIKINDLNENIIYKGVISDRKVLYKEYSSVNFILSLSHYDTFNVSVVESLSVGTPVIVSNNTGAFTFAKKCGIIIDLNEFFYDKIFDYINLRVNNNSLYENDKLNCYESIKYLNWDESVKKYLRILYK